jgi:hypothetical protein
MKKLIPTAKLGLQTIFDDKFHHHTFPIDCTKLPAYGTYSRATRTTGYLGKFFKKLDKITTPVIYWFETIDSKEADRQFKLITAFARKHKRSAKAVRRITPLPNANLGKGSKVLYVGKRHGGSRKKDGFTHIADRMEMHLGYNPKGLNQGIQLAHWNDGEVVINILELSKDAGPYLSTLEQLFAIELQPLLGRH